jgi:hypothetical protein
VYDEKGFYVQQGGFAPWMFWPLLVIVLVGTFGGPFAPLVTDRWFWPPYDVPSIGEDPGPTGARE